MKVSALIRFLSLFLLGLAAVTTTSTSSSSSSSVAPTTVWVTITTGGALATVQSLWVQSFMSTYSDVTASAPAGSVGMGTVSGTVGDVRSYTQTTPSTGGGAVASGSVGLVVLLLNWVF